MAVALLFAAAESFPEIIIQYLHLEDVRRALLVCKELKMYFSRPFLWKILHRLLGHTPATNRQTSASFFSYVRNTKKICNSCGRAMCAPPAPYRKVEERITLCNNCAHKHTVRLHAVEAMLAQAVDRQGFRHTASFIKRTRKSMEVARGTVGGANLYWVDEVENATVRFRKGQKRV